MVSTPAGQPLLVITQLLPIDNISVACQYCLNLTALVFIINYIADDKVPLFILRRHGGPF